MAQTLITDIRWFTNIQGQVSIGPGHSVQTCMVWSPNYCCLFRKSGSL